VLLVELCNEVRGILDVTVKHPTVLRAGVALPLDKVVEMASDMLRVEYFLYFILLISINNDWFWFRVCWMFYYLIWLVFVEVCY
jgi:hypothetical protein